MQARNAALKRNLRDATAILDLLYLVMIPCRVSAQATEAVAVAEPQIVVARAAGR